MTNYDTSTLSGAIRNVGQIMVTNLTDKGVTASENEGLVPLANKINDIPYGKGVVWSDAGITGNTKSSKYLNWEYIPTLTVNNTGTKISISSGGEAWMIIPYPIYTDTDFEMEYTIMGRKTTSYASLFEFSVGIDNGRYLSYYMNGGTLYFNTSRVKSVSLSSGDTVKLTRINGTVKFYINDTQHHITTNRNKGWLGIETYTDGRYTTFKDLTLTIL